MGFRVAIGSCDCKQPYTDTIQREVCTQLGEQLTAWRARLPGDIGAIPTEFQEVRQLQTVSASFAISKHQLQNGDTLVVLRAFVRTWSRPTFFSLLGVGRMYTEGLVVTQKGEVDVAPDEVMWEFR